MIVGFVLSLALALLALVDFRRGFLFTAYPARSLFYAFNPWQLLLFAMGVAGMFVCHRCDNPPCVRPDHLFLGTQFENMGDCAAKMRHVVGNKHPHSKLNPDAVREIRRLRSEGLTQPQIAVRFGVAVITVCKVLKGYSWAHVK